VEVRWQNHAFTMHVERNAFDSQVIN